MEEKNNLTFLWDTYQKIMGQIKTNRKASDSLIENNQELRRQANLARENLIGIIQMEANKEGSLYAACLKSFGKIDHRFYNIVSMVKNRYKKVSDPKSS